MADIHCLFLVDNLAIEDVVKLVLAGVDAPLIMEERISSGIKYIEADGPGFFASGNVVVQMPKIKEHYTRRLGFTPAIEVAFLEYKNYSDKEDIETNVIRVSLEVLRRTTSDAGLMFTNFEHVILVRKDGQIILKGGERYWTPERLQMIDMPYTHEEV